MAAKFEWGSLEPPKEFLDNQVFEMAHDDKGIPDDRLVLISAAEVMSSVAVLLQDIYLDCAEAGYEDEEGGLL